MSPVKGSDETKTTSNVLFSSATEYRHYSWEVFTTTTCGFCYGGKNSRLPNSVRIQLDLSANNDSKLSLHAISVSCSIFIFTVSWLHMHFSGNIQTCCKLQNWAQKIVTYHQCQITVFSGELSITSFCETGILNSKNAPFNIQDNW